MKLFASSHKEVYRNIHNFLAGRFIGATRERALLNEVIKCLFCRIYLLDKGKNIEESDAFAVAKMYREVFSEIKKRLLGVFDGGDEIMLDPESILFFNEEIKKVELLNSNRDPFGDLYEVFIGTGVREEEGQFFTPKNGVELLVSLVAPQSNERIIDPACGAGGFLTNVISYLNKKGGDIGNLKGKLFGIDKDEYLVKLARTHVALLTMSVGYTFCGDSLAWINKEGNELPLDKENYYDVVLTNPPFGKKIVAASKEVQKTFELGYIWKKDKKSNTYIKSNKLKNSVPPQVLFLEKCIKLIKKGGRMGIVLPESLITSSSYSYVVQYLKERCKINAVIGMPEDFFKTSGKGGTHTKACLVVLQKKDDLYEIANTEERIFFAEAKWCGHDSRGRRIEKDDLPRIIDNYQLFLNGKLEQESLLGYSINRANLVDDILSPRYYNPEIKKSIEILERTHDIVTVGQLVEEGILEIKTGDEVGKLAYGTGTIPFVRTSDISSWEVKLNPKHGVSEEYYQKIKNKQDIKPYDILMVKDGTYLIGTCAILTEFDCKIIYQSHLYKIRVLKPRVISPFLLLAILSSSPIKNQIKAKRFTQDIIDSLGKRIHELKLPIPKNQELRNEVTQTVEQVIRDRIKARELARKACLDVATI